MINEALFHDVDDLDEGAGCFNDVPADPAHRL